MFTLIHATSGALLGEYVQQPVWTFVLAFVSHFFFDIIPHGDQKLLDDQPTPKLKAIKLAKIASVDLVLTVLLFWWLLSRQTFTYLLPALLGAFAAVLPDVIAASHYLIPHPWLKKFSTFNYRLHFVFWGFTISIGPGLVVQTITLVVLLGFLIK